MPSRRRTCPWHGPPRRLSAARPVAAWVATFLLVAAGLGAAKPSSADVGGTIAAGRSGDVRIHVLAFPLPLSVGPSDWSILVRDAETGRVRDDLQVEIRLGGESDSGQVPARPEPVTAGAGRHPGFYSARIPLNAEGGGRGEVSLRLPDGAEESLRFEFDIRPRESPLKAHWGSLLLPFVLLGGLAWHQQRVLSTR